MRRVQASCIRAPSLAATRSLRAAMALMLVGFLSPPLSAAISVWDGGGSNNNWTTRANWLGFLGSPGVAPANDGTADIIMGGTVRLAPLVDVPYSIRSLSFNSSAGPFVIGGADLTIGTGGVTNNDADIQSVFSTMKLTADQTWTTASGRLQMGAADLNGFDLTFAGAQPIDMTTLIVGSGDLTVADAYTSTVTMLGTSDNTYTGLTNVQGGTLKLQRSGVAVPGDLTIGDGGTVLLAGDEQISEVAGNQVIVNSGGLLDVNTRTETIAKLVINGGAAASTSSGRLITDDALVTGATATWTNSGVLYVGHAGAGTLTVTNGGHVASDNLRVGYLNNGTGTLSVSNGASLSTTAQIDLPVAVSIGNALSSSGTIVVDGVGSNWIVARHIGDEEIVFAVGNGGTGALDIINGGQVMIDRSEGSGIPVFTPMTRVDIGKLAGSSGEVSVDGDGSIWTINITEQNGLAVLSIGDSGDGSLEITNGGEATISALGAAQSVIGSAVSATGAVRVDGTGSRWQIVGQLYVGGFGHGTLNISDGGVVISGPTVIGVSGGSVGSATIDGDSAILRIFGQLVVADEGSGTLIVTNDGTVQADSLVVGSMGEIQGDGRIVPRLNNLDVQNGGLVSPGTSPGALNIDGNYTQTANGELLIELASAASYDQLLVTGTTTLDGTLAVIFLDGFMPSLGQSFTILTADDVNGTFAVEPVSTVPNLAFDVIYNAQSVVLSVVSALPGDYNVNGIVDAADYVVWRKNEGTQEGYDTWRANFGATIGNGAGSSDSANAAIPEPACLALVFAWLVLMVRFRQLTKCVRSNRPVS